MRKSIIILILLFSSCSKPKGDKLFYAAKNLGKISDRLDEASGLVASVNNPGMLWSINDSGNEPSVFLVNDQAHITLTCTLTKIENRDWEDITLGPGPVQGVNYLYIGDIGDNSARYDLKFIYRFPEPVKSSANVISVRKFDTLILKLPDRRRDTETMMIDPASHDLYIVSKREDSVILYQAHYPFPKDTIVMVNLGKLPYKLIVAGSISSDGSEVLLKNYNKIYYWKRNTGESLASLLKREPLTLSYEAEHQGEAIAWSRDSQSFYTLSESSMADRAQLRVYKRRPQIRDF